MPNYTAWHESRRNDAGHRWLRGPAVAELDRSGIDEAPTGLENWPLRFDLHILACALAPTLLHGVARICTASILVMQERD